MQFIKIFLTLFSLAFALQSAASDYLDKIVAEIKSLESERDPKCYATASRLENFMFGTPLSDQARFSKNKLQSQWVKEIWLAASSLALRDSEKNISSKHIEATVASQFKSERLDSGHWKLNFSEQNSIVINQTDLRQYSSIAYSLRAVLAVQQESILDFEIELLPLEKAALTALTLHLDLLNLAALKISDRQARKQDRATVEKQDLVKVWNALVSKKLEQTRQLKSTPNESKKTSTDLSLLYKIIAQKIESYSTYNDLSNKLFNRNLQVYFARMNLSKEPQEQKEFSKIFNETMIQFAFDVYKESEKIAVEKGHKVITEADVNQLVQLFIPHQVNQFEDAIFFNNLPKQERILVESYDADSFRDNSSHWWYLLNAIKSKNLKPVLQPDPFALELIAENIALFGVLTLKMSGIAGRKSQQQYLSAEHYRQGLINLSELLEKNSNRNAAAVNSQPLYSNQDDLSANPTPKSELKFSDITRQVGLEVEHRTSDWLSRLLRSYLQKSEKVGVIFIPPAFGGGGVAAEDFNNDGFIDLIYLSGSGNVLLKNQLGKGFVDMSAQSGIQWLRQATQKHGEPRQPIIVDFDNDGLPDLFISYANDQHRIYKNLGDFRFKDMTDIAKLGGLGLVGGPATAADFDNDGLLDLYITYFGPYVEGVLPTLKRNNNNASPNQLFKNIGGFKFVNVTKGSGVDNRGWSQAVSHSDIDGDGKQDIIVGNDFGINAYYINQGNLKFKDKATIFGTDKASYSMNIGIADLNNDLVPDFYISNIVIMNKDEKYVLPNDATPMKFDSAKLANMRVIEANDLYLSGQVEGNQKYQLSSAIGRGYSSTGWSWGADFFDYDNDTDNDLYVLNGMNEYNVYNSENPYFTDNLNQQRDVFIPIAEKESNVFFENSDGKLSNQSKLSGLDFSGNSRSAAYLDFDNDGDLDIAVNNFNESAKFFRNNLSSENSRWIALRLVGNVLKKVNRDAIGAKIIVSTTSGKKLWREVHSSVGYMSGHPKIQYIGLGLEQVISIEIVWPNGQVQKVSGLEYNQQHVINQP